MMNSTSTVTFQPIGGSAVWPTGSSQGASAGSEGLYLAALPGSPLSLDYRDGSLGGLVLPKGLAIGGDGTLYLLQRQAPWQVKRYDPLANRFEAIEGLGGKGQEARQFIRPRNLAVAGRNLYVADAGNRRVQVFLIGAQFVPGGGALRHVWSRKDWVPVDVAGSRDWAYILDGEHGQVYRHHPEMDTPQQYLKRSDPSVRWRRLVVDDQERVYLLNLADPRKPILDMYDPSTDRWQHFDDAGAVRGNFTPPAIRMYFDRRAAPGQEDGVFCLPESLARPCGNTVPGMPPSPQVPLGFCSPGNQPDTAPKPSQRMNCKAGSQSLRPSADELFRSARRLGRVFTRDGEPADTAPDELREPQLYQTHGTWISQPLDSSLYRCQWHRVELELAALPPGCRLVFSTLSDAQNPNENEQPKANHPLWENCYQVNGPMQAAGSAGAQNVDFLVQSRPGQYLWLKVELAGDGYGSPLISKMRVHYPRQSYLAHLPAIFSEENSRWFLERFLSIFQTEWDEIEQRIQRSARYFDPSAVPADGGFLEYLAGLVALPLEDTWTQEQKRSLLQAVPEYYPRRGTPKGLEAFLRIYLKNMDNSVSDRQDGYPLLVEGFRERQRMFLSVPGQAGGPLWGPGVVGRPELGVFSTPGEVRLVSTGDPQRDLFYEHAHRFKVYVPSAWVRSADQESMLRRALESEKPAQAAYTLVLVEPRFRVGVQSTIGLDTILGQIPTARLSCAGALEQTPPSQPPRNRLGMDTVLGGRSLGAPMLPASATLQLP